MSRSASSVAIQDFRMRSIFSAELILLLFLALLLVGCNETPAAKSKTKNKEPKAHLVEVITVASRPSNSTHERNGTLKSRKSVRIHTQEEGSIQQLPFYEGDLVKKGTLLVQLDDRLLRAELDKAKATQRQTQLDKNRIAGLVKKRAASKDELARANTALDVAIAEQKLLKTRLGFTRINAPIDGVITQRLMEPGDLAAKHNHLLTLTDPLSLVIEIHLSELLIPHLKPYDPVLVRIDALGNQQFPGTIIRIHPELDPVTRQGLVEITLNPIPAHAKSGQFARVTIETKHVARILIPFSAIRRDRVGEFVYLMNGQQKAIRTSVRSGIRIADQVEALEGLREGDQVITRGFLGISEGKRVSPVNLNPKKKTKKG